MKINSREWFIVFIIYLFIFIYFYTIYYVPFYQIFQTKYVFNMNTCFIFYELGIAVFFFLFKKFKKLDRILLDLCMKNTGLRSEILY